MVTAGLWSLDTMIDVGDVSHYSVYIFIYSTTQFENGMGVVNVGRDKYVKVLSTHKRPTQPTMGYYRTLHPPSIRRVTDGTNTPTWPTDVHTSRRRQHRFAFDSSDGILTNS